MNPLATSFLFQQFLTHGRYLKNVTPSTIEWYETAFKALQRCLGADPPLTRASLQQFVVSLRQRDVKPVSCNTYIKALNTFRLWLREEGHIPERVALSPLKFEKRLIQTLTDDQMKCLLGVKPQRFEQWRLHAIVYLLLDSRLRIEEAPTLRVRDLNLDNLLVTVFGKGRKERRVPFSFELRKVLFRYEKVRTKQCARCELVFPSREGTHWDQRNSHPSGHRRRRSSRAMQWLQRRHSTAGGTRPSRRMRCGWTAW